MPLVELIYDADCPNVEAAREQLRRAFDGLDQQPGWQEWDRCDPASPPHARQYGSPTILVDGRDVTGAPATDGAACCRVYRTAHDGLGGAPPVDAIVSALRNGITRGAPRGGWRSWVAVVSAVGVALLPNLACPACWPAYAGLLSSIGLGFLTQTAYLVPFTAAFLIVAVGALGYRARHRHGYGPFLIGLVAATLVVVGKFEFASNPAMYGGITLLIGASVWNTWPRRKQTTFCPVTDMGRESA